MNKGQEAVNNNELKQVSTNHEPRMPYPKVMMKDRTEKQFSDDTVTLQAHDSFRTSKTQDNAIKPVDNKSNTQSSLQEPPRTKTTETVHYYHVENKDTHEEQRLQIEELDEWQAHKPRTYDKPKLCQNKPDTSPNQLQVGDKDLLDATDPYIDTTTPNEEIPLTILSIFPFGTIEVSHPKFGTLSTHGQAHGRAYSHGQIREETWSCDTTVLKQDMISPKHRVVLTNNDDPSTIHFRLGDLVRAMSVLEFGKALAQVSSTYDPSRSKASALPPSLRYLHAILAHTLTGRRESTYVVNTHDAYCLWCMAKAHVTDLAYFIAFAIRHQTEQHRKGVISIGPYVTRLARHFGLLNTAAQSLALSLIGQMSLQGIMTMLHMRMIQHRCGTDLLQYLLSHAIDEEDLEDIPDDVPHSVRILPLLHLGND
ncbi:hypothetical protein GOBAR_AA18780 [Gossypium barbadense]|uniref:Uncharacterized protein n=1 Tax=Gossypium barbadense TaxID=3634 RepID=A0A2P5XEZ6_GOSBA|nr:hypothetical protein GOBAR_AA18780 [Gossypium barbadense]